MTAILIAGLFAVMSIWGDPTGGDVDVTRADTFPSALVGLGASSPRPQSAPGDSPTISEREAVTLALAAGVAPETGVVSAAAAPVEPGASVETAPEDNQLLRYVSGSRVNLRDAPSTNSSIVGVVSRGDRAEVVSDSGSWVRVRTDQGIEAWIFGRFLSESPA